MSRARTDSDDRGSARRESASRDRFRSISQISEAAAASSPLPAGFEFLHRDALLEIKQEYVHVFYKHPHLGWVALQRDLSRKHDHLAGMIATGHVVVPTTSPAARPARFLLEFRHRANPARVLLRLPDDAHGDGSPPPTVRSAPYLLFVDHVWCVRHLPKHGPSPPRTRAFLDARATTRAFTSGVDSD